MSNKEQQVTRKKRGSWFVHLIVFVVVQIGFFLRENLEWTIFDLNNVGLWFEETMPPIKWMQLYDLKILNYVTLIWGILLLLDGLLTIRKNVNSRREKVSTSSS